MSPVRRKGQWSQDRQQTFGGGGRRRRVKRLNVELLEDRTLLASLQFTAGFGEQSTLDSVVQTPNTLSNVNTPASRAHP